MAGTTGRKGMIVGINVTPLVDITLVLLVIFIVTAKIVVTPAVPLDLPEAASSASVQVIFSVVLDPDGGLWVDGARLSDEEALGERAQRAVVDDPELRAVIQADGDVPHRKVIAALDALRTAGVTRIAFGAVPTGS